MQKWLFPVILAVLSAGCSDEPDPYADSGYDSHDDASYDDTYSNYYSADEITFLDEATSNAALEGGLTSLTFVLASGEEREVRELAPDRNLVVVVTRGNTDPICPYCSTQTARLISSYEEFSSRNTEVAVVYPVAAKADSERLGTFLDDVKTRLDDAENPVPFPVLLDVELKGVDQLGIRKDLSKPATYIVDQQGQVQFAYVGEHIADRPSVSAILAELDRINESSDETSTDAPPAADRNTPSEDAAVSTSGTDSKEASSSATDKEPAAE